MVDPAAEARIKELKRRLDLEPGSHLFVALAEEYRKAGRLTDALSTLQKGLLAHPNYLSAHVALGRTYLEAGQITESIATFSRVLSSDPANLVSAKSLADIYLSRGDSVEAIKKYKLYRALSGDRSVEGTIERLELELAPPPPPPRQEAAPPPPPTFFEKKPTEPIRPTRDGAFEEPGRRRRGEPVDVTSVQFELDESRPGSRSAAEPMPLSRDVPLAGTWFGQAAPAADPDAITRAIPPAEVAAALAPRPAPVQAEPEAAPTASREEPPGKPSGRVLADLYFAQGHHAEALAIYDDLVASNPHDHDLRRLRRDAEARLLPAAATRPGAASPDPVLERRLGKIRALKRWLSVVQTG